MADVHRPLQRQRNFRKHAAIIPRVSLGSPKGRVRALLGRDPIPGGIAPYAAARVTAVEHELQVVAVGYTVRANCKCGDVYALLFKLVVPAERAILAPSQSQGSRPR